MGSNRPKKNGIGEAAYFCGCGRAIIDRKRKRGAWCDSCKKLTRTKF